MSRIEKFGRRRITADQDKRSRGKETGLTEEQGDQLTSRVRKYPSNRYKLTHWFYRFLIFLFIMLAIGLLLWGKRRYGL